MSLIPGTLYVFNNQFKVWTPATHNIISDFAEAKKALAKAFPPGSMIWNKINFIYSQDSHNYYYCDDQKWFITDIEDEISTLRELKEIESSIDEDDMETLINGLITQGNM
jgi:hypothetical protein